MADKGHKALFNDSQVLISWGKELHRSGGKKRRKKKKRGYRFHKLLTNSVVVTHTEINALF